MQTIPNGLIAGNSELNTALAFDNYDRFIETVGGKDTLHDTVGIVYQSKSDLIEEPIVNENHSNSGSKRRRKYISPVDYTIVPYSNQKPVGFLLSCKPEPDIPRTLQLAANLNNIWMISRALRTSGKRWFEWHTDKYIDPNPVQKIGYLPPINHSPTSDAAVKETLEMALKIAQECQQKNIMVTYDLAIAIKAFQIQAQMKP